MTTSKIGIDTGGTFTDFVWLDNHGRLRLHKQRSTPTDPSDAILSGLATNQIDQQTAVIHGSTVATNAILERRGVKTALITTAGFADILAIGRQNRPDLYALVPRRPEPFVPAKWRFEVRERITAQGDVLTPLHTADLPPILQKIRADEVEAVAICTLFSFLHPAHEQAIAHWLTTHAPDLHLSLSSEILPEYREYERTSTTVLNAYVAPLMSRYLARLAQKVGARPLAIMQSNGGLISPETAGAQAARTALSGPAGGVVGAQFIAAQAGYPHLITFDMGGTSTDVALLNDHLPTTSAGQMAGWPLRLPMMDIHTVGAGGGSLGYVDAGGALHVGPESAGANPGPACYPAVPNSAILPAHINSRATVTDANLVLGRLDAAHFLGGAMALNTAAAQRALTTLAGQMGVDTAEEAAWGLLQVANAHMERAIRQISIERGHDPRHFTLVPFGGAGPLHACELAENLQIPRVLVPPTPGVLSALGMLVAAPTKDYSQTVMLRLGEKAVWPHIAPLVAQAKRDMAAEGHAEVTYRYALDMRYVGQSHELKIPVAMATSAEPPSAEALAALFHEAHRARYGYAQSTAVELVTVRVTAVAPVVPPSLPRGEKATDTAEIALIGQKEVWFAGQAIPTKLYARDKLGVGHALAGPAVLFQYDTTLVVPPRWSAVVDAHYNLVLTFGEEG